jgi:putative oxidoreductase
MNALQNFVVLLGRLSMSPLFLWSGYNKVIGYSNALASMTKAGLPVAQVLLPLAILLEIGSALALIVGFKTRCAALALFVFTLITALFFHNFWAHPEAQVMRMQLIHFMKNMAICGGLLVLVGFGPGRYAIDRR